MELCARPLGPGAQHRRTPRGAGAFLEGVPSLQEVGDGDWGLVLGGFGGNKARPSREASGAPLSSLGVPVPSTREEQGGRWMWIYSPKEMSGRAKLSPPGLLLTSLSQVNPQSCLPPLPPHTEMSGDTSAPPAPAPGSRPAPPPLPVDGGWCQPPTPHNWESPGLESNGKNVRTGRNLRDSSSFTREGLMAS